MKKVVILVTITMMLTLLTCTPLAASAEGYAIFNDAVPAAEAERFTPAESRPSAQAEPLPSFRPDALLGSFQNPYESLVEAQAVREAEALAGAHFLQDGALYRVGGSEAIFLWDGMLFVPVEMAGVDEMPGDVL